MWNFSSFFGVSGVSQGHIMAFRPKYARSEQNPKFLLEFRRNLQLSTAANKANEAKDAVAKLAKKG